MGNEGGAAVDLIGSSDRAGLNFWQGDGVVTSSNVTSYRHPSVISSGLQSTMLLTIPYPCIKLNTPISKGYPVPVGVKGTRATVNV